MKSIEEERKPESTPLTDEELTAVTGGAYDVEGAVKALGLRLSSDPVLRTAFWYYQRKEYGYFIMKLRDLLKAGYPPVVKIKKYLEP